MGKKDPFPERVWKGFLVKKNGRKHQSAGKKGVQETREPSMSARKENWVSVGIDPAKKNPLGVQGTRNNRNKEKN